MKRLLVIGALVTFAGLAHLLHVRLDQALLTAPDELVETLPTVGSLQLISLGYDQVVADYYWMRALEHFGTPAYNAVAYPLLEPLLRRVLTLDPYFKTAYTFAGTALTVQRMDPAKANALLEQGLTYRPDVWQIPYFLGFNRYYFQQDYVGAAEALSIASKYPDAPPLTAQLATRIAAHAGRPDVGIQLIDEILERTKDEQLRASYIERRKALQLDLELGYLNRLVPRYLSEHGKAPTAIGDFVKAGYLREPPRDPYGKEYRLDSDGFIHTESEGSRLRLKPQAAGSIFADGWHPPYREDQLPPE
ncbi:MAG: tetratricopeptide repeat protein [Myxococcota bacterium]